MKLSRPALLFFFFLIAPALIGYAYFIEPRSLAIRRAAPVIPRATPALDGLKIVAISDIHAGSNGVSAEQLRGVVSAANAENADLVVLLGDYVSFKNRDRALMMPLSEFSTAFSGLKSRFGMFAVLGNQDDSYGADAVSRSLESAGYTVLNGNTAVIETPKGRLRVVGLKDQLNIGEWKPFADVYAKQLAPTEGTGDVIVLSHSPDVVPIIAGDNLISGDLRLMLSGHTHGGQVRLPVVGRPIVPSGYGQKYAAGFISDPRINVFVTTGLGTSLLPFRFLVPPEIAVITIRSE